MQPRFEIVQKLITTVSQTSCCKYFVNFQAKISMWALTSVEAFITADVSFPKLNNVQKYFLLYFTPIFTMISEIYKYLKVYYNLKPSFFCPKSR